MNRRKFLKVLGCAAPFVAAARALADKPVPEAENDRGEWTDEELRELSQGRCWPANNTMNAELTRTTNVGNGITLTWT